MQIICGRQYHQVESFNYFFLPSPPSGCVGVQGNEKYGVFHILSATLPDSRALCVLDKAPDHCVDVGFMKERHFNALSYLSHICPCLS